MSNIYPPDVVELLKAEWAKPWRYGGKEKPRPPLPDDEQLAELLSIRYHASLLREEGRPIKFRVIICPQQEFKAQSKHATLFELFHGRAVLFPRPHGFSVAELRRLAPAAEYARSLIYVSLSPQGKWITWGLLAISSSWWNYIHHEASMGRSPAHGLTISSSSAGELIFSAAGDTFFSLRTGGLYFPSSDLLFNGLISDFLAPAKAALYAETIENLKIPASAPNGHDNDYPNHFYCSCLSRVLSNIRDKGHGGTLIVLRDEITYDDPRLTDRATLKYPSEYNHAWSLMVRSLVLHRKYHDLHSKLWHSKTGIATDDYQQVYFCEFQLKEIEEGLSECLRFLASLSSVDGAVIITDRLRLLGFGAEVIALSPTLVSIKLALDVRGEKCQKISIENYGTRHRSAFRFCSSLENSIAFIVSQDGGVKATKRHKRDVFMWPEVGVGSRGM